MSHPQREQLLDGMVAIVTGGDSGIGQASSVLFANHGARVVVADLNLENAKRVANTIGDVGGTALAVAVDIRQSQQVQALTHT